LIRPSWGWVVIWGSVVAFSGAVRCLSPFYTRACLPRVFNSCLASLCVLDMCLPASCFNFKKRKRNAQNRQKPSEKKTHTLWEGGSATMKREAATGAGQVPLLFTVYALISFSKFKALDAQDAAFRDDFFELPPTYRLKTIDEIQKSKGYW
jgi:hypothetical protein